MIIGMDVLRKLHVYLALNEHKMYVSYTAGYIPQQAPALSSAPSSPPPEAAPASSTAMARPPGGRLTQADADKLVATMTGPPPTDASSQKFKDWLGTLNTLLDSFPAAPALLERRCLLRAQAKTEMEIAAADCDKAVQIRPQDANLVANRAMVLYISEKYKDALAGFDAALAINPKIPFALLVRGYAKGKLGDAAGKDADIAAAKTLNPDVQNRMRGLGITD
jgi:tetratricopeptide (TPR) repeat protein